MSVSSAKSLLRPSESESVNEKDREQSEKLKNKKVLLRERKRHTACRVASARYAALCNGGGYMGYPPGDEVPPQTWGTLSEMRSPLDLRWSTPTPRHGMGYPPPT